MGKFRYGTFLKQNAIVLVASVAATVIFFYHSYTVVSRHLKHEVLQVHKVVSNESLLMPVVSLKLESYRRPSSTIPHANITFEARFIGRSMERWSFVECHPRATGKQDIEACHTLRDRGLWSEDWIDLNVVDASNSEYCRNSKISSFAYLADLL